MERRSIRVWLADVGKEYKSPAFMPLEGWVIGAGAFWFLLKGLNSLPRSGLWWCSQIFLLCVGSAFWAMALRLHIKSRGQEKPATRWLCVVALAIPLWTAFLWLFREAMLDLVLMPNYPVRCRLGNAVLFVFCLVMFAAIVLPFCRRRKAR